MSARRFGPQRQTPVFHIRLGCCGGCGDVVDMLLRGRLKGCPPLFECASPRHAELIVVTGLWNEELAERARAVIDQAPDARKVVFAGDCALGGGPFAERVKHLGVQPEGLEPDSTMGGCPCTIEALCEEVRHVVG